MEQEIKMSPVDIKRIQILDLLEGESYGFIMAVLKSVEGFAELKCRLKN